MLKQLSDIHSPLSRTLAVQILAMKYVLDRGPHGLGTYSDGLEILMSELLAGEAAGSFSIPSSSGMLPCRVLMSLLA